MGTAKGQGRITVRNIRTGEKSVLTQAELQILLKDEKAKDPTARMTSHAGMKRIVTDTTQLYEF